MELLQGTEGDLERYFLLAAETEGYEFDDFPEMKEDKRVHLVATVDVYEDVESFEWRTDLGCEGFAEIAEDRGEQFLAHIDGEEYVGDLDDLENRPGYPEKVSFLGTQLNEDNISRISWTLESFEGEFNGFHTVEDNWKELFETTFYSNEMTDAAAELLENEV